jgi:hypothetical protein
MNVEYTQLQVVVLMLVGAAGGFASFLVAIRQGHYNNNKYMTKSSIEIVGGAVTATCLVYVIRENQYVNVFAFLIGTAWSHILQRLRTKITSIVEAALGDASPNKGSR